MRTTRAALAAILMLNSGLALAAGPIDYQRDVKPILAGRCYACHGALQQKGKLRVDAVALMIQGGRSGPAVSPGKSAESLLIQHVTAAAGARRMPPESEGEGLKQREIALLRTWIDQGAKAPPGDKPEADPKDHWAFRAPVRPALPPVKTSAAVKNPVDAFIEAELERRGLAPQPDAKPQMWLRRIYLDLIGLPPTREEIQAFVTDPAPDKYEKVADRLLATGQYGERWGRHFMDIWRYSDWWGLGAEVRNSQKHIWHWRDWIVESLNADKGYDQMLREMLAADELYPKDLEKLRATGFLVRSYFIFNRNTWMEEVIEHTSKAFLGLTMNCSRCHDHKYDPIRQTDYYRFRAFFEPYQVRTDQMPGATDYEKDGLPRIFDCNLTTPTYLFVRGDDRNPRKDQTIEPGVPPLLSQGDMRIEPVTLPPEAYTPALRPFVLDNYLKDADQQIAAAQKGLAQAKTALAEAEKHRPAVAATARPGAPPAPIFRDDFAKEHADRWQEISGRWKREAGKLLQQQDGDVRGVLRLKQGPPADFEARFQFTITGGRTWHSVGLTFDAADGREILVYLSAYAGGPKVQIAYNQGAGYVYPPGASQARPIKDNEPQELMVRVRGAVVNVEVNREHALAYRLPFARRAGNLELITYDAKAYFSGFQLSALPADYPLIDPGREASPFTVEQARAAVMLAEKTLAAAQLQPARCRAVFAAERARHSGAANAKDLARQAATADKQAAAAKADEDLARAELDWLRAEPAKKAEMDKKRTASRTALEAARKALASPGETYTGLRGSLKTPENNLETMESRLKPYPTTSSGRRSALAKWLTDPRHPLPARVVVNHVWARHFGKPLVPTVFDFGRKGASPTHPALLDWLAVDLREHGWSLKRLHRLIVTSTAYRRTSSAADAATANLDKDPENRFYWRTNPLRMEAQVVRDSLLSLAGDLDLAMGGPSIPADDEASRRRSLYFVHSHNEHQKFLSMFDDANVLECYRRAESIVPQQALALENSKLTLAAAEKIAARLGRTLPAASDTVFVRAAFETILASPPTAAEQAECETALTALAELLSRQKLPDASARARVTLVHVLLNHNDFITIR